MKVSVIIPIYKVEAYIERCVRSLMGQTMKDVEYIFVDDCSPDKSMAVLQQVIDQYPTAEVKVLKHEVNKGLPAARNTGLAVAAGDYIFHCDSDDYLEPDALERMYEVACKNDADIVYTDWYLTFEKKQRYMKQPAYNMVEDALRGLLHGTMKYNVWNKLVRRQLYEDNQITFPDGHSMGEDMTMILLFACAKKVCYLPIASYHYVRQNENAFTASRSETSYQDLLFNANRVIQNLEECVSDEDIAAFKLNVKFPFLISNNSEDYDRWNEWYPEANRFISGHGVSRRTRMLEMFANMHCYLPLRIHYYLLQALS